MKRAQTWIWILLGVGGVAFVALQAQDRADKVTPLTALDYAEIQNLNAEYGHYIDTGEDNGYAWARLFAPDGIFIRQEGDDYKGHEKLAELARKVGRGPKYVAHFNTNVMVKASPGGATGRASCVVIRFPDDKMGDTDPRPSVPGAGCRYLDSYVKTNEGWRFKSRTVVVSSSNRQPG
jgi:hypothetical protein